MAETGINFKNLRGIRCLMIAKLLTDTDTEITHDKPVRFAGVRSVGGETEESTGTEHYDNQASIVINAEGADTYPLVTSVLEEKIQAIIEGRIFDEENGVYFGTPLNRPYNALGFIAEDTNGQEYYYWIYKGKFSGGKETHETKTDGTDSTNMEFDYTSIYTNKRFDTTEGKKSMKFLKVKAGGKITEEKFMEKVIYPEDITAQVNLRTNSK